MLIAMMTLIVCMFINTRQFLGAGRRIGEVTVSIETLAILIQSHSNANGYKLPDLSAMKRKLENTSENLPTASALKTPLDKFIDDLGKYEELRIAQKDEAITLLHTRLTPLSRTLTKFVQPG
jgi:hypothetical protein